MYIKFKKAMIFYTSQGEGNPLVLLHGFLESSNIWKKLAEELSKTRQVICIDLPGHGKSDVISEVHSMELMADAVHTVLEHLKIKKATFAGHSMGGYVSLAFCEKFPIMTLGLVLINSTPEADTEERKENRDRAIALIEKNKKTYVNMAISNLLTQENTLTYKTEIQKLKKEASGFPSEGIIAALKGMKIRTNKTAALTHFDGVKYIIAGKDDPILNYAHLQEVAKICKTQIETCSGGHLTYIEDDLHLRKIMHFIE